MTTAAAVYRFRRRASTGSAGAPSQLYSSEAAFNEKDNILYYGAGDDGTTAHYSTSVIAIGGPGFTVQLAGDQSVDGVKTFTSSPLVPTVTAGDSSSAVANTAFVANAVSDAVGGAITGAFIYKGTVNITSAAPSAPAAGWTYRVTTGGAPSTGTSGYTWSTTVTTVDAGDHVVYNGTTWDRIANTEPAVTGTSNRITITATGDTSYAVDISSSYVGQTSITTVGTISSGTWSGTAISLAKGGTGADLSGAADGTLFKKSGTTLVAAVAGVDYIAPGTVLDGGTF